MIGSIRKHSAWLWWVVAGLTILSFVIFMGQGGMRGGAGRGGAGYGVIYGKPVTPEEYDSARRAFIIDFLRRNGQFPSRANNTMVEGGTYYHLLLVRKAQSMNIQVSSEAVAEHAQEILREFGNGRTVPITQFVEQVLQRENLDAADFQRFVETDLAIQQLIMALGLSGALVTPQEAGQLYDHDHREVSVEGIFFSATNYFSQVTVMPAAVAQFYTNNMAAYRQPERVQVNYLEFDLTNYLTAAEQKLGTNLADQVNAMYAQHALEAAPDAKTPEEAKAKIRESYLRQTGQSLAVEAARQFTRELFAMVPLSPENLVTLARKKGLAVRATAPFSNAEGPEEFPAPAELTATAFKLNAESPFSPKPIAGAEAVYVIGLAKQLPSAIPPLDDVRPRVIEDFQHREAALKARSAGTNFHAIASAQLDGGKTFAQAAIAAGLTPMAFKPFSLSSASIPEAGNRADPDEIKRTAFFDTPPGRMSHFVPTVDGGFVLFVQSFLAVDEARKKTDLPKFVAQLRRQRENEAFNLWVQAEANRELGDILRKLTEMEQGASAKTQP